jgi:hypothetical protein
MYSLINFISFLAIVYLHIKAVYAFGGSDIFLYIVAFAVIVSSKHKVLRVDISIFLEILLLLMFLNYLVYIEHERGFSSNITVLADVTVVLISMLTSILIIRPFGWDKKLSSLKVEIKKRVVAVVSSTVLALTLLYTGVTTAMFTALFHDVHRKVLPKVSLIILGWFIFSLVVTFLRGRKIEEEYVSYLVTKRYPLSMGDIKKRFLYLIFGSFILGGATETIRGLWSAWFLTWLAFLMIILTSWRTWQHTFTREEGEVNEDVLDLEVLPDFYDIRLLVRYFVINLFIIIAYSYFFMTLWYSHWRK